MSDERLTPQELHNRPLAVGEPAFCHLPLDFLISQDIIIDGDELWLEDLVQEVPFRVLFNT